jgi:SAM-dependent methyltransferase
VAMMKKIFLWFCEKSRPFGLDPSVPMQFLRGMPFYVRTYLRFKGQQQDSSERFPFGKLSPILHERTGSSGIARGHYFHQDLLVAQRIFKNDPDRHVDIGSRIDGFVAHLASFRTVEVFDIRSQPSAIANVTFVQGDLMKPLPDEFYGYCDSISCLHALEHFGLGRYGDPINFEGHLVGFDNIHRMLRPGGRFYFSVPIGPQRIEFNAHRVFSVEYLLELFRDRFSVERFSYVDDTGDLHRNVSLTDADEIGGNFNCNYGCGVFELRKE